MQQDLEAIDSIASITKKQRSMIANVQLPQHPLHAVLVQSLQPQWSSLPITNNLIELTSHKHAVVPIFQVMLESNKLKIKIKH